MTESSGWALYGAARLEPSTNVSSTIPVSLSHPSLLQHSLDLHIVIRGSFVSSAGASCWKPVGSQSTLGNGVINMVRGKHHFYCQRILEIHFKLYNLILTRDASCPRTQMFPILEELADVKRPSSLSEVKMRKQNYKLKCASKCKNENITEIRCEMNSFRTLQTTEFCTDLVVLMDHVLLHVFRWEEKIHHY